MENAKIWNEIEKHFESESFQKQVFKNKLAPKGSLNEISEAKVWKYNWKSKRMQRA